MGFSWYSASSSSMRREHVLARSSSACPEVFHRSRAHHVRRVDQRVAAREVLIAHPVFEDLADDATLGVEEDQTRARRVPEC